MHAHALPPRTDAEVLAGLGTPLETSLGRWARDASDVPALIATYIEHNLRVHDEFVRDYPGVNELVDALHRESIALAIVTSKRRRGTAMGLRALKLDAHFATRVCADDVERAKPDPEPVLRALDALGVDAARAVFIGDAVHDIEAGRAAGVTTIAVGWGAGEREALLACSPDAFVESAEALREVLLEN